MCKNKIFIIFVIIFIILIIFLLLAKILLIYINILLVYIFTTFNISDLLKNIKLYINFVFLNFFGNICDK